MPSPGHRKLFPDVRNLTSEQLFAFFFGRALLFYVFIQMLEDCLFATKATTAKPIRSTRIRASRNNFPTESRKIPSFTKVIQLLHGEPSPLRLQNPKATVTSIDSRVWGLSHLRDSDTRMGWLFNESDVKVGKKVGSGSFGTVYIAGH